MSNGIIGQEKIKNLFFSLVKNKTLGHCYALEGEKGMGKSRISELVGQMAVCENHNACGTCKSCVMALAGTHPDIEHIIPEEGKKTIGVEVVRKMISGIYVRPYIAERKVIIINNFELAMPQAQNAVLKVLEEPPEYVLFLLTVSSEKDMLDTVKSRCVLLKMQPYSKAEICRALSERAKLSPAEIEFAAAYSGGNIGKAFKIVENENFAGLRQEAVDALTELTDNSNIMPLVNITGKDRSSDIDTTLECITSFLRDVALIRMGLNDSVINIDYKEKLERAASKIIPQKLIDSILVMLETRDILKRNINYNLAVSHAVLCSLEGLCKADIQKGQKNG